MKRLLTIIPFLLCTLLFSVQSKGQNEIFRCFQYGYSSQYGLLYVPAGYDTNTRRKAIIWLGGAGERGNGAADTALIDNVGPPRYIRSGTSKPDCIVFSPQCPDVSLWPPEAIEDAIDWVIANYNVSPDMIYLDGYSLGYTGVFDGLKTFAYKVAAVHALAGDPVGGMGFTTAYVDSIAKVSVMLSNAGGDSQQPIGNSVRIFDSLLNPNHTLRYQPRTNFFFGSSHGASDEIVYADYGEDISRWLMLHHRNKDSTASFFVDSLVNAGINAPWNMFTRAQWLVNSLSASAHKTHLEEQLINIKNTMNGGSDYVRIIMDLGVAAKTSPGNINNMTNGNTGQVLSNMIDEDGAATTWDFRIVLRTNTTEEEDVGEVGSYWYFSSPNAFDDVFSIFDQPNAGSWRIEGLDNTKTYTIRMTGGGAVYSAGTQYGLNVVINGVTRSIPLSYKNTDAYVEYKGISPSSNNITIEPEGIANNAVTGIGVIEIIQEGSEDPALPNAGNDTTYAYNQDDETPAFYLNGTATGGAVTTWAWTQVSGPNTATITNADEDTATVTLSTKGVYVFRLTLNGAASDEVQIYVRDYNEAGSWPCREGGGETFEIGESLISGVVLTTALNMPYVNRDLIFGELVQGHDTIRIHPNPNNGGIWNTIVLGGFGGAEGCPVVVMPYDTNPVLYGSNSGYFRLASAATGDTNFINYVKIDGSAHRVDNQYVYGFQAFFPDYQGLTIVAHNFRNLEVCGVYGRGGPIFMKKDSDSTKPWSIYNNYNPGPLYLHDIFIDSTDGEGFYLGTTDIDGGSFDGPTQKGADGSVFERIIVRRTGWDGFQLSNYGYNNIIRHMTSYKTGQLNQSSQQASIFLGGNSQGGIDSSVSQNGTGGMSVLGKGSSYIRNCIIDSVKNGGSADVDNIFVTQALWSTEPPPFPSDSLKQFTEWNIISRIERDAIFHSDANNRMKAGAIRYNYIIDPTRTTELIDTNAPDTVENNTYNTDINLDTSRLACLPAYKVLQLIKVPANYDVLYSFYDVTGCTVTPSGRVGRNYLRILKKFKNAQ